MKFREIKITRKYDVYFWEKPYAMTHGGFIKIRVMAGQNTEALENCFCCDYKFKESDVPMVMYINKIGNRFICDKCFEKYYGEGEISNGCKG